MAETSNPVYLRTEDAYLSPIRDVTRDRYVLLIDIMGFSEMILTGETKKIQRAAMALSEASDEVGSVSFDITDAQGEKSEVETALFSDTIIAWTDSADASSSLPTIIYTALKLTLNLFEKKLPFRGAIAKGEFAADKEKSIYVGKPLVDAHRLSCSLEFFGTVFHHSVDQVLPSEIMQNGAFQWVKVPIKKGGWISHNIVFPLSDSKEHSDVSKSLDPYMNKFFKESSGEIRKYIENSAKVYRDCREIQGSQQAGQRGDI